MNEIRQAWLKKSWEKIYETGRRPLTTGIGSLPHVSIDAALSYVFRHCIPYCPQLPVKNPHEFMIAQALEKLPGLRIKTKGEAFLVRSEWERHFKKLEETLNESFARENEENAFDFFAPSEESYEAWKPFLWEVQERKPIAAKIQLAGPMTCQWSLRMDDGSAADKIPEVGSLIFKLCLARSLSMARTLRATSSIPIFYIDEPGFYGFTKTNPRHILGLQELRLFIQTLQKEKILVGVHCCSNTDWKSLLALHPDILSIDTTLALAPLLKHEQELEAYLSAGGVLSLGVIPTAKGGAELNHFDPLKMREALELLFRTRAFATPKLMKNLLDQSLFTPACGLALHSVQDTEIILGALEEFASFRSSDY